MDKFEREVFSIVFFKKSLHSRMLRNYFLEENSGK
ncbi:MAG: hypothetical protein ACI85O_003468, partial [Saprospiraceae bacterium]